MKSIGTETISIATTKGVRFPIKSWKNKNGIIKACKQQQTIIGEKLSYRKDLLSVKASANNTKFVVDHSRYYKTKIEWHTTIKQKQRQKQ